MKKIFIWLLVLINGILWIQTESITQAISGNQNYSYSGYKKFKQNNIAARLRAKLSRNRTRQHRPTYRNYQIFRNRSKSKTTSLRPSTQNYTSKKQVPSRQPFFHKNFLNQRKENQRQKSHLNRASRNTFFSTQENERYATVKIIPHQYRKPIETIDSTTHPLMDLSVGHGQIRNSQNFIPALQVLGMEFEIVDNEKVLTDLNNFELVIGGENFVFDRYGKVIAKLNNWRIAAGEKNSVEIGIRIKNPDTVPQFRQNFRVKLKGISIVEFGTSIPIPTKILGTTISQNLTFLPLSNTINNGIANSSFQNISGRILGAGETENILGIKLRAALDDLVLKEVTVKNTFGNNVDTFVSKIDLIDFRSGKVLDSTRFLNGKAHFRIRGNQVLIPRSKQVHLGFRVSIVSDIPNDNASREIKLAIEPEDLELWGYGSGKELPNNQKFISFTSDTFSVAQNGGGTIGKSGISHSENQPDLFPTGQLQTIYRFGIQNDSAEEISIDRISANIFPTGVEFIGGGIPSDFALKRMFNGRERNGNDFSVQYLGNNKIQFKALSEIYIAGRSTQEFAVQVALRNISGDNRLGIQLLGDSTPNSGTLTSLQNSGANFIWSDHSGRPHINGSADWLSGYLFPGLPTSLWVNKDE